MIDLKHNLSAYGPLAYSIKIATRTKPERGPTGSADALGIDYGTT
jgi:hypothetical protein